MSGRQFLASDPAPSDTSDSDSKYIVHMRQSPCRYRGGGGYLYLLFTILAICIHWTRPDAINTSIKLTQSPVITASGRQDWHNHNKPSPLSVAGDRVRLTERLRPHQVHRPAGQVHQEGGGEALRQVERPPHRPRDLAAQAGRRSSGEWRSSHVIQHRNSN